MSNKMIYLATIGLLTFNDCNGMNIDEWEKNVLDYCKYELDNSIENNYLKYQAPEGYKPKKNETNYDRFIDKMESHSMSKGKDLRDFVLNRSKYSKRFYTIQDDICRISDNILAISKLAFYNNKTIKEFILPKNLLGIDCMAFAKTNIIDIYIPDSVVALAPYAFYKCENLEFVSVSKNTLGVKDAFEGCSEIEFEYR